MKLADRILEIVKEKGIKISYIAEKCGVSRQSVGYWMNPDLNVSPRLDKMKTLAEALGTTEEYLLFGIGGGNKRIDEDTGIVFAEVDMEKKAMGKDGIYLVSFGDDGIKVIGTCIRRFKQI